MELAFAVEVFSVSQSDSGGHYEHLFLPKALAVLDSFTAPPLVGSKKAPHTTRQNQWSLRAAECLTRIHVCKSGLKICPLKGKKWPAVAPGVCVYGASRFAAFRQAFNAVQIEVNL